mmetsp:Transcript_8731/g.36118  ORF Transcript_8731/g.36118 Transcript_8731/m.36118 type:complete len:341 (-) Transcript_8731:726-1748(-)
MPIEAIAPRSTYRKAALRANSSASRPSSHLVGIACGATGAGRGNGASGATAWYDALKHAAKYAPCCSATEAVGGSGAPEGTGLHGRRARSDRGLCSGVVRRRRWCHAVRISLAEILLRTRLWRRAVLRGAVADREDAVEAAAARGSVRVLGVCGGVASRRRRGKPLDAQHVVDDDAPAPRREDRLIVRRIRTPRLLELGRRLLDELHGGEPRRPDREPERHARAVGELDARRAARRRRRGDRLHGDAGAQVDAALPQEVRVVRDERVVEGRQNLRARLDDRDAHLLREPRIPPRHVVACAAQCVTSPMHGRVGGFLAAAAASSSSASAPKGGENAGRTRA